MSKAIDWLFQYNVITEGDVINLLKQHSLDQARLLMMLLHSRNNDDCFIKLVAALKEQRDTEWVVVDIMKIYNKFITEEASILPLLSAMTLKRLSSK